MSFSYAVHIFFLTIAYNHGIIKFGAALPHTA